MGLLYNNRPNKVTYGNSKTVRFQSQNTATSIIVNLASNGRWAKATLGNPSLF